MESFLGWNSECMGGNAVWNYICIKRGEKGGRGDVSVLNFLREKIKKALLEIYDPNQAGTEN